MVEFDVQLSSDGVPVIFHDDDCTRLLGTPEAIHAVDWNHIQSLRMRNLHGLELAYRIPSLEEFLQEFGNRQFYLELKVPKEKAEDGAYVRHLGEKVSDMVLATNPHAQTFLASFHEGILRLLAQEKRFPILAGIFDDYTGFRKAYDDGEAAEYLQYYSLSWKLLRRFNKDEIHVKPWDPSRFFVWNINGLAELRSAAELKLQGLVSDDVETLLTL